MVGSTAEPGYTLADVERLVVLVTIATRGGLIHPDAAKGMVRTLRADLARGGRPMHERLLRTHDVAARLAVCDKTVLRMADDGRLTRLYLRPGKPKSLRFRESDVDALISGMQESTVGA